MIDKSFIETEKDRESAVYDELGDMYLQYNINQAYLCYENAEFLCDSFKLKRIYQEKKNILVKSGKVSVKNVSIVIVSYNSQYLMEKCLESIRKYCNPWACEVVVVDNASTDGVREWLQTQKDIKLVLSAENLGFPKGCNVGVEASCKENDIFFLNNDTRVAPNALFWVRMGLYEEESIGATGCISNYSGNEQQIDVEFALPNDYLEYGREINVYCDNPYEERNRLCGFAMMVRRNVLNRVGGMDERLSPGYLDDDDLSLNIKKAGYRLVVCHNSFIYHAGSQSFIRRNDLEEIYMRNYLYMLEKWQFDFVACSAGNSEAVESLLANHKPEDEIAILEIGAGCGNTLGRLRRLFPNAILCGIEENELAVKYAIKNVPILAGDWRTMEFPFAAGTFDYVIYTNRREEMVDEELLISRVEKYAKDDAILIV